MCEELFCFTWLAPAGAAESTCFPPNLNLEFLTFYFQSLILAGWLLAQGPWRVLAFIFINFRVYFLFFILLGWLL